MGHTVSSQRRVIDKLISELHDFGRALRAEDRQHFEKMLNTPLKYVGCISYASSMDVWAFLLLTILLEQQKRIEQLEKENGMLAYRRIQEQ